MYNPSLPFGGFNAVPVPNYSNQNGILKVNGIESAKAYPSMPNTITVLFDADDDIFYLKSTDANNFQSIRVFRFEEVKETAPEEKYVTMDEFKKFKEEILNGKQHIRSNSKRTGSYKQYTAAKANDEFSSTVTKSSANDVEYAPAES